MSMFAGKGIQCTAVCPFCNRWMGYEYMMRVCDTALVPFELVARMVKSLGWRKGFEATRIPIAGTGLLEKAKENVIDRIRRTLNFLTGRTWVPQEQVVVQSVEFRSAGSGESNPSSPTEFRPAARWEDGTRTRTEIGA